ncbi:hypothetical protein [Staphylococcus kloosii]|uniref:hypothetical protein n=1 Tax=Staphylococcus kloosii TaxID=29384 RepID=UPI000D1E917B|nr:hypothetical protein [Staphylococcus kloosii]PTJ78929.1 hypothetical protein BUZ59_05465 [Staphylococcus kloosii]
MKNLVKNKDYYGVTYYSSCEIDIEKIFEHLYGKEDCIKYENLGPNDIFLLQLQTVELLSNMEKDSIKIALENISMLNRNSTINTEILQFNRALEYQLNNQYKKAHSLYRNILTKNPRNRLAFFAIHMLEFNLGWQKLMLETTRIVLNQLEYKDDNYYGYTKGIESFALIENGLYEEGKKAAIYALQINSKDIYSIHAMCHYFYEAGKYSDGINWMEKNKRYWISNRGMRIHVWWHLALFHFYDLNFQKVKTILNNEILVKNVKDGLEDLDATSIIWRLYLLGEDKVCTYRTLNNWDDYVNKTHFIFNDLHALMAYILKNDNKRIELLLKNVKERKRNIIDNDHLNLLYGFYNYGIKNYKEASNNLSLTINNPKFGGSNAQRDVISLTLFFSLFKSGNKNLAIKLLKTDRAFKNKSKMSELLITMIGGDYY